MTRITRWIVMLFLAVVLVGCAQLLPGRSAVTEERVPSIAMPLYTGWFEGEKVYYVITDISEQTLARAMGVNYAPRLRDAVPPRPKPPTFPSVVERVYVFIDDSQGSVFQSIPWPLGPDSRDERYSPLWLKVNVRWLTESRPAGGALRSEEGILEAEASGQLALELTSELINCPVVGTETAGFLPNMAPLQ